ncbi:MAG: hypothetical protein HGA45_28585, partial [Chloroflexales bacterium]|nr:hypothetical protein [Chloroflexales bacterium]
MLNAKEKASTGLHAAEPPPEVGPMVRLAHLGRQLLLVPEALLLAALLGIHSAFGPSPLLAL